MGVARGAMPQQRFSLLQVDDTVLVACSAAEIESLRAAGGRIDVLTDDLGAFLRPRSMMSNTTASPHSVASAFGSHRWRALAYLLR